ncbi:MAG: DUF1194 domain-containing protein [Alphaproteobacteria bacterium]|nr:DUF1194 domain-containing protein [Alphaproteobacteria bacterium]
MVLSTARVKRVTAFLVCAPALFHMPVSALGGDIRPVELELVLAIDTSVSVDDREYALQLQGVAHAFRDRAVIAAIRDAGVNGIAVTVVQWGVGLQQRVAVDWTHIHDGASAESFAREVEAGRRLFVGNGTGLSRALTFASEQFGGNGFSGRRRVIDVSGDGRNNSGRSPAEVRDQIVAAGIVVNGLAVLDGDTALGTYFERYVAGGAASFVLTVGTFEDFAVAMRAKLLREITVPMARSPGCRQSDCGAPVGRLARASYAMPL